MQIKKVSRLIAAVATVAMLATACGDGGSDDDGGGGGEASDGSIWVLLPDSASSDRWETDDRRFFEEAFTEAGVDFNIVNAEGDPEQQLSQAEQAIASGAGVILLDIGTHGQSLPAFIFHGFLGIGN